jgi:anti-sigma B factor antagonist
VASLPPGHRALPFACSAPANHDPLLRLEVGISGPATTLVKVVGEIDIATAPLLSETLRPHLATGETVLVDLSAVTFLSVAGLNVLVDAHRSASAGGGHLKLVIGPRCVNRVLSTTGLDTVLDCYQPGSSVLHLDSRRRP